MTLKEITNLINQTAIAQPAINDIIESGNIYDINSERDTRFSAFCATLATPTYNADDDVTNYTFYLYYVDRLTADGTNKIDVQSTGIEVLKNIIRSISRNADVEVSDTSFTVFTESFSELCAGCYATVTFSDYGDGCVEDY